MVPVCAIAPALAVHVTRHMGSAMWACPGSRSFQVPPPAVQQAQQPLDARAAGHMARDILVQDIDWPAHEASAEGAVSHLQPALSAAHPPSAGKPCLAVLALTPEQAPPAHLPAPPPLSAPMRIVHPSPFNHSCFHLGR